MAKREGIGNVAQQGEFVVEGEFGATIVAAFLAQKCVEREARKPAKHQSWAEGRSRIEMLQGQDVGMIFELDQDASFTFDASFECRDKRTIALGHEVRAYAAAWSTRGWTGPMILVIVALFDELGELELAIEDGEGFVDAAQAEFGFGEDTSKKLEGVFRDA